MEKLVELLLSNGFEIFSSTQGKTIKNKKQILPSVNFKDVGKSDHAVLDFRNRLANLMVNNGIKGYTIELKFLYQDKAIPWETKDQGYQVRLVLWRTHNKREFDLFN